jgi:hypothetical protein
MISRSRNYWIVVVQIWIESISIFIIRLYGMFMREEFGGQNHILSMAEKENSDQRLETRL